MSSVLGKDSDKVEKYSVVRIDEDVFYGCEEKEEDTPVMALVTLRDQNGTERVLRHEDDLLYDRNIQEGDTVTIGLDNTLQKQENNT